MTCNNGYICAVNTKNNAAGCCKSGSITNGCTLTTRCVEFASLSSVGSSVLADTMVTKWYVGNSFILPKMTSITDSFFYRLAQTRSLHTAILQFSQLVLTSSHISAAARPVVWKPLFKALLTLGFPRGGPSLPPDRAAQPERLQVPQQAALAALAALKHPRPPTLLPTHPTHQSPVAAVPSQTPAQSLAASSAPSQFSPSSASAFSSSA